MTDSRSPDELAPGRRIAYHLTPAAVWLAQAEAADYRPEAFAAEGFIHCTHGEAELLDVANRYYQSDERPYVVLDVDLDRVAAPVRYEDEGRRYPHVHGPLHRHAIIAVRAMRRSAAGTFVGID